VEFEYTHEKTDPCDAFPEGYLAERPVIYVRIGIGEVWIDDIASVIDTGADFCIFYGNFAADLGLDWESLPIAPAQGIGKSILRVASVELDTCGFGIWPIRAAFTPHPFPFALLGHAGFLERFKFSTNGPESKFTLERLK
jgi:hypothetical protein